MRVACSRCDSQYEVPDDKLVGGAVRIRCSRCSHVFAVRKRAAGLAGLEAAPPHQEARPEDFGFGLFEEPKAEEPSEEPSEAAAQRTGDLFAEAPERTAESAGPGAEPPRQEARFEDFDFGLFEEPKAEEPPEAGAKPVGELFAEAPAVLGSDQEAPETAPLEEFDLPSLGELDLGDFSALEEELGFATEPEAGAEPEPEKIERVRREELVSVAPSQRAAQAPGPSEVAPRLDLQGGPRSAEAAAVPSRLLARDRRRSPLFWVVVAAAAATAVWTAYVVSFRLEGLTFLNPSAIRELWRRHEMDSRLALENLQGFYRNAAGGRRFFLIRGEVVNRSGSPQGLVRVKGRIFGPRGAEVASREVYCGNILSDSELATLARDSIDARLQNQFGEALSNVDIAPSAKVPFMVVFPSPPNGVEKYDVSVTAAKAGSGT